MARRSRAFTLVEVLISMVIFGILGGVILTSLWIFQGVFYQTGDTVGARQEIEYVFQSVGREITNVSLGMPNNRKSEGSFSASFESPNRRENPIMFYMGASGEEWGGPVTLASFNGASPPTLSTVPNIQDTMIKMPVTPGVYDGPQIYYAWSVPALRNAGGAMVSVKVGSPDVGNPSAVQTGFFRKDAEDPDGQGRPMDGLRFFYFPFPSAVDTLMGYQYDGRSAGLALSHGSDTRSWVTFPTLRVPLLLAGYVTSGGARHSSGVEPVPITAVTSVGNDTLALWIAPNAPEMDGILGGFEELHVVQACRLYVNANRELVQEFYGDLANPATNVTRILAHHVAGMHFRFDKKNRLLTMYLAVLGEEADPRSGTGTPAIWPSFAAPFTAGDLRYRIFAQSVTWRIRN
jgi:prepilin-type N-terminal cleavage/methylation domain-containing protein